MAEHLEQQLGVPAAAIDLEDASTTTRENLRLSRPLVRAPLAVVTSEYHAYRTAGLLAEAGMQGTVVGAWTRPSYRPGAIVREALAIAAATPRTKASPPRGPTICNPKGMPLASTPSGRLIAGRPVTLASWV